ncbi:MAG: MinD/ParA family protein [Haloarcula sp.]
MISDVVDSTLSQRFKGKGATRAGMLAIAGGKGGCGKTTTALGLAQALAAMSRRPLVVDTDRDMPNLHHRAGIEPTTGISDIEPTTDPATQAQWASRVEDVEILPCLSASAAALGRVVDKLAQRDRPVLLDCPAGSGPDAALPLRAADRTVLVSAPDRQSLTDTAKTAAMAHELDAPPVLTVLVGSDGAVDPSALLSCSRTVHIPSVSTPLDATVTEAKYVAMVNVLIDILQRVKP